MAAGELRPLNARNLVLSLLLGLDEPVLPARSLVALAEPFGIAAGTMRTALSRMVTAGDLTIDAAGYHLGERLLERKVAQDIGRRPAGGRWDGTWWVAVVTAPRRSVAERRAFRTHMANLRMGELRPDTWLRPANLDGPDGDRGLAVVRGPLSGEDAGALAAQLWPLPQLARTATRLTERLAHVAPAVADGRSDVWPGAVQLAAEVVRFLRAEPLLPGRLTPQPWPPDALREQYRAFDRLVGRAMARLVGAG